jgi:hypothetical protein
MRQHVVTLTVVALLTTSPGLVRTYLHENASPFSNQPSDLHQEPPTGYIYTRTRNRSSTFCCKGVGRVTWSKG